MDAAKDILAGPFGSTLLKWEYWPYYLAAFAVLVLLILLIVLRVRGRTRSGFAARTIRKHIPSGLRGQPEQIPRSSLRKVWKRFLAQIPGDFRWAIQTYDPFIVLGDSGSGKSLLIDNNTDWRGQAGRFYPSYTVDPLLQIYLGSRALVMEVPAPLLNNTSPQARNALLRLWKPLFKGREATVVVVLNAPALLQDIPENLRRHAQVLRGKIDILSSVQKRPVKVCIALSHMDQVEGFSEFAEFLHKENLPLDISLLPDGDEKSLAACLGPYEALLPRALTSMSSDDYLKIVSFFSAAPQFLSLLSSFTRILRAPDPLSPSPRIVRLCLTSRETQDPPVSNPFLGEGTVKERVRDVPNLRHRLAATAILVTGMLYLGLDYYLERSLMVDLDEMLGHIDQSPLDQYEEYSHGHFMEVSEHLKKSLVMYVPPDFFPQSEDHVRWHFSRGIRNYYLLPAFRGLGQGEDAHEKGIYLLGLIYATRSNDLGRLVLANAREWTKTLNLPEMLIRDYVSNNDWAKELTLDLTSMPNEHPRGIGPMENPLSWSVFVNNVQKACEEPSINKEYLHALQKEADSFLRILDRISRYKLTNELVTLLKRYLPPGAQIDWIQRRDVLLDQEPLQQFLMKVKEKDIDYPSVVGLGLMQFIDSIRIMAKQKDLDQDGDKEYRFRLYHQEEFQFSAAKWNSLVLRSRITLFIREFLAQNKRTDGLLFFDKTGSIGFPDLVMNPSNDGMLFFVGKGKVDGRFSKSAFEQQVKPVLAELPEVLKGLPVVEEEKKRFTQFILKQAEAYADRYVSAYRTYYSQFHLAADSLGGLRYLIKQIQLPTSPFQDFLTSVKENTALDVGDSPFLRQFAKKLGTFESIRRLMAEKDGTVPELDKYKALLKQMDDEIDSNEPFTAANKADDANELKRILSPLGRISLSIQRGENDSYVSLVRMWIKSVGMDAEWQQPFLEPATIAFFVGRGDVESSVEKIWSDLEDSYLKTLFSKFPFNQKAEVEATPSELEKVIHPQGAFWKTFRDYLAPICRESSGFWTERVSPQGFFRIPQDMLPTVNELSRLTAILWNDKGVAQPLNIEIKPAGLPPRTEHAPTAILSYLRSDKSSVFAFNQQPAWQKLQVEWWKAQTSAVGVEFEAFQDTAKAYREIIIAERFWSFYHLLSKAEPIDKNIMVWRVAGPAPYQQQVRIEFALKSDPWTAFQLKRQ